MKKKLAALAIVLLAICIGVVVKAGPASAASPTGANVPSGGTVMRGEFEWSKSGCPPGGSYTPGQGTYWNMPGGQAPGTVRYQTMWPNGVVSSSGDVADGHSDFRGPSGSGCYSTTIKTEVTRLSDNAQWCLYIVPDSASISPGGCPGIP